MSQHNIQTEMANGPFPTTAQLEYTTSGYMRGWGTALPTLENWAPGAIFQVVSATAAALYKNDGTSTTASWTAVSLEGGQEDFGTSGLKTDVVSESTSATGVTVDGVLLKDSLVQSGLDGTAGSVKIYPATADKGYLDITCTNQTGDTVVSLVAGAMAAARTITLRDPGAAASLLTTTDGTAAAVAATAVEIARTCDVSARAVLAGSTLAVTEALHDGKTIQFDQLAGSVCTLPAASGSGARFRFATFVLATSNSHVIKVANATDILVGTITVTNVADDTNTTFSTTSTSDTITLNRTDTGSQRIGEMIELEDIKTGFWAVRGNTFGTGAEATPFSATV